MLHGMYILYHTYKRNKKNDKLMACFPAVTEALLKKWPPLLQSWQEMQPLERTIKLVGGRWDEKMQDTRVGILARYYLLYPKYADWLRRRRLLWLWRAIWVWAGL
jgi:hypothetical protein